MSESTKVTEALIPLAERLQSLCNDLVAIHNRLHALNDDLSGATPAEPWEQGPEPAGKMYQLDALVSACDCRARDIADRLESVETALKML